MSDFHEIPEGSNVIPGQVVVKLTKTAQKSALVDVPPGPLRGLVGDVPNRLGVSSIDSILEKYNARLVNRLHGPSPSAALTDARTSEMASDMAATYRVRFAADEDPEKVAAELKKASGVVEASAEYYRYTSATPNDPDFGQLWGMQKIRAPEAWDRKTGCTNVIVGVLDTGCDLNHPDLAPNLIQGRDMVDLPGASAPPGFHFEGDRVGRDNIPQDEVGHGTHVAGTIGAVGDNGIGVVGVCWTVKIMPVKVLTRIVNNNNDNDVRGVGSSADVAAGIRWATDNGAQIINMSLSSPSSTFVEQDAVAYAVSKGVLVVAAMGNHGNSDPHYPAAYPDVFSVGAINQAEQKAPFSATGSHIDVVAPGVGIRSTDWDDTYSSKSGTSMATPHVAGLAALMKCCKSSLTAVQIADIIRQSAKPLRDNPGDPVPNDNYGHGLIDAKEAMNRACPIVLPPKPCIPCIPCQPCLPPPCRPCLPPPPCRPCLPPPPPCQPCLPPPPCQPCLPCKPCQPCQPCLPCQPCQPCQPCLPCQPCGPGPCGPCIVQPLDQASMSGSEGEGTSDAAQAQALPFPCLPCLPPQPCLPCRPCLPCQPCLPCRPCLPPPCLPCQPCTPCRPCGPCILQTPTGGSDDQTAAAYGQSPYYGQDWSGAGSYGQDWSGYPDYGYGYDWYGNYYG